MSGIRVQSTKGSNRCEWVIFVLLLRTNSSSGWDEGEEGRAGGIGLLVAPYIASYLFSASPESPQAGLYSDHPQNKCQKMKRENARCALGTLSYIDKSIMFVCLFQMELQSLGPWSQGRCDHPLVKVWIFYHTREMHRIRLLGKQKPAPFWVLCGAVCCDQIPAVWWLPLAMAVLKCSTCNLASWV